MGKVKTTKGFTVVELLIATIILSIILVLAANVYTNFFSTLRNLKAANAVYEEARFTMERIVKEVRGGTIDYEEYYNQRVNFFGATENDTFGQNYCQYSRQFFSPGPDGVFDTFDDQSTGVNTSCVDTFDDQGTGINTDCVYAIDQPIQDNLYIISASGNRRTYLKRIEATDISAFFIVGGSFVLKSITVCILGLANNVLVIGEVPIFYQNFVCKIAIED